MTIHKPRLISTFIFSALFASLPLQAQVLPEAAIGIKIPLAKKATTRPMTVAYVPFLKRYYIADGGLAPMGSEFEAPISKSQIHAYDDSGKYIQSARPGFDNRSIYYNANTGKLETITYNISSEFGFGPNTGLYSINLTETGDLTDSSDEIMQFNPAFGSAGTMPTYDAENKRYFAKQGRSDKVLVVDPKLREKSAEITLDLVKAGAAFDDVSDYFVAYTGIKNEELILLDVDHKAALVFDITGKFVARSELPKELKLRSNNHYNGLGYANDMLFVFHENEGEFGTYYGFKILK
jgi:hypothetical protein